MYATIASHTTANSQFDKLLALFKRKNFIIAFVKY